MRGAVCPFVIAFFSLFSVLCGQHHPFFLLLFVCVYSVDSGNNGGIVPGRLSAAGNNRCSAPTQYSRHWMMIHSLSFLFFSFNEASISSQTTEYYYYILIINHHHLFANCLYFTLLGLYGYPKRTIPSSLISDNNKLSTTLYLSLLSSQCNKCLCLCFGFHIYFSLLEMIYKGWAFNTLTLLILSYLLSYLFPLNIKSRTTSGNLLLKVIPLL